MIEKEVETLIKGEEFTGEFQGVSYEIKIYWGEDWCVLVELINFKPLADSHTHFWLGKVPDGIIEDVLYDAIYQLPEVKAFQKRIDAMRKVDGDVLDSIIEKLKNRRTKNESG